VVIVLNWRTSADLQSTHSFDQKLLAHDVNKRAVPHLPCSSKYKCSCYQ
jgi:hypothetical protein